MAQNSLLRHKRLRSESRPEPESPYRTLYGLRENPFPSMALFKSSVDDPRQNGEIYDPEFRASEEKLFLERFVAPPTGDKPLEIGFLRLDPQAAGRGNGKSTFLHRIMLRINGADWRDWINDADDPRLSAFAVHVLPKPKEQNNFFQLMRLAFETIMREHRDGTSLGQRIDHDVRAALLVDLLNEDEIAVLSEMPEEKLRATLTSADEFRVLLERHGYDMGDVRAKAAERLQEISSRALGNEFTRAFIDADVSVCDAWACWREKGWTESDYRWSRKGADWLVNGLVPILVLAGYQRLYVLLDEFEKIYMYQSARKREEFLDLLRQVFYEQDSAAVRRQYITTILSIHPSIDRYLAEQWQRVGLDQLAPIGPGEIDKISVALGASKNKRLTHLLGTYMDWYRDEDDPHRGTLYPFADGALEPAIKTARRFPRNTLRLAHMILQQAVADEIPAPISRDYVEAFLPKAKSAIAEEDDILRSEIKLED